MRKTLTLLSALFLMLCFGATNAFAAERMTNTQITNRLNFFLDAPNFSKHKPLSQSQLMDWILMLGYRGAFPVSFKGQKGGAPQGYDDYTTRSLMRLFVRQTLGQDLKVWSSPSEDPNPKIVGDKMGWRYNSGNTMHARPYVQFTQKKNVGKKSLQVKFNVLHQEGNLSMNPPLKKVGSGTAILERAGKGWILTSWQVKK